MHKLHKRFRWLKELLTLLIPLGNDHSVYILKSIKLTINNLVIKFFKIESFNCVLKSIRDKRVISIMDQENIREYTKKISHLTSKY